MNKIFEEMTEHEKLKTYIDKIAEFAKDGCGCISETERKCLVFGAETLGNKQR